MKDQDKTKEQLIDELQELRRRVAAQEGEVANSKRTEEALRQSEERFRAVFEEAPVGMIISGADGVVVKVNQALCKMSGFSPEDIVGHQGKEFTYPDDLQATAPLAGKLFSGEVPSFTMQKRYRKKDGGFLWAEMTAAAIREPGGKIEQHPFCKRPSCSGGYSASMLR